MAWHQDKTIALNRKINLPNWGPWSIKEGTHHTQVDEAVLNKMITFRIHLDSADKDNGCLQIIPNSHKYGVLSQEAMTLIVAENTALDCEVEAGDLMIMRPHILHSSKKSRNPKHRRVLHLEYSNYDLPKGIRWA